MEPKQNKITKYRNNAGLSKSALARIAGISRITLITAEKNISNTTVRILEKIAKVFEIKVKELFE